VNTRSPDARTARADDKADLATILDDVWRHLHAGANAGRERSPYTIMQLATIGRDGFPKLRTVVLREAGRERSALRFHTDVRSEKAREMACNGQVALLSSDVQAGIQIRMEGLARLVEEEDERLRVWNADSLSGAAHAGLAHRRAARCEAAVAARAGAPSRRI
jgi:pyridoxine/pyridoxamine 5'-phosphate oxidase